MTVLLCGFSQTHPGTSMPSGGGHIIRAAGTPDIAPVAARLATLSWPAMKLLPQPAIAAAMVGP